jgi:hypothetical protein
VGPHIATDLAHQRTEYANTCVARNDKTIGECDVDLADLNTHVGLVYWLGKQLHVEGIPTPGEPVADRGLALWAMVNEALLNSGLNVYYGWKGGRFLVGLKNVTGQLLTDYGAGYQSIRKLCKYDVQTTPQASLDSLRKLNTTSISDYYWNYYYHNMQLYSAYVAHHRKHRLFLEPRYSADTGFGTPRIAASIIDYIMANTTSIVKLVLGCTARALKVLQFWRTAQKTANISHAEDSTFMLAIIWQALYPHMQHRQRSKLSTCINRELAANFGSDSNAPTMDGLRTISHDLLKFPSPVTPFMHARTCKDLDTTLHSAVQAAISRTTYVTVNKAMFECTGACLDNISAGSNNSYCFDEYVRLATHLATRKLGLVGANSSYLSNLDIAVPFAEAHVAFVCSVYGLFDITLCPSVRPSLRAAVHQQLSALHVLNDRASSLLSGIGNLEVRAELCHASIIYTNSISLPDWKFLHRIITYGCDRLQPAAPPGSCALMFAKFHTNLGDTFAQDLHCHLVVGNLLATVLNIGHKHQHMLFDS